MKPCHELRARCDTKKWLFEIFDIIFNKTSLTERTNFLIVHRQCFLRNVTFFQCCNCVFLCLACRMLKLRKNVSVHLKVKTEMKLSLISLKYTYFQPRPSHKNRIRHTSLAPNNLTKKILYLENNEMRLQSHLELLQLSGNQMATQLWIKDEWKSTHSKLIHK